MQSPEQSPTKVKKDRYSDTYSYTDNISHLCEGEESKNETDEKQNLEEEVVQ